MANCPVCKNPLLDDIGLVECARCGAALFVEFDGSVQLRDEVASRSNPPADEPTKATPQDLDQPEGLFDIQGSEPKPDYGGDVGGETSVVPDEQPTSMTEMIPNFGAEGAGTSTVPLNLAPDVLVDAPQGLSQVHLESPTKATGGISEIEAFANSEASSGRDGAYFYRVMISGIDTADVRDSLRAVMADALFAWDADQLLKTVRAGNLEIPHLTAIKAALFVSRISALPVQIQWVQNAISQS